MKHIITLFVITLLFMSCQDTLQDIDEPQLSDTTASVRDFKGCKQNFTPGNIYEGLFGEFSLGYFDEEGWSGSFEQQFFPCPVLLDEGDCCNDVVVVNLGYFPDLPFNPICNPNLDAQELKDLADYIVVWANNDLPTCDGITLNLVAVNVRFGTTLNCTEPHPCPLLDNACDCYEDFPDDPYWAQCESYSLQLEVKYARTTPCLPPFTDSPIG